jgi:hypothetical protein
MRGGAHAPCPECKSTSRHKSGCSKPPRNGAAPAKAAKGGQDRGLELYSLDELVQLRADVAGELRKRKEQAEEELEKLQGIVG